MTRQDSVCRNVFWGQRKNIHTFPTIYIRTFGGLATLWNATTGECLQTLEGHTDEITCVAVLPDGCVVSGSSDSTLRIWKPIEKMRIQLPTVYDLMDNCLSYLRFLEEQRDTLFSRFRRIDENTFELSLDAMKAEKDEKTNGKKERDAYQVLISFMQKYRYSCEPTYTIDFDWGLSSGEENMLRIFSSLYHVFDRDYSSGHYGDYKIYNNEAHIDRYDGKMECNTVLLFMDEADLTLHPEWQRRLIEILTTCIPRIYPASCAKDIQLILTTHSPLILGDIPSENITYLFNNTEKKEIPPSPVPKPTESEPAVPYRPRETFGQNIHTILKENFFLGNGTVGAFAGNKINWIAKRLDEISRINPNSNDFNLYKEELEDLQRYIRIVAPGVLRARLEQMYRVAEAAVRTFQETIGQKSTMEKLLSEANALSADERERLIEALQKKEDKQDD